MLGWLDGKLDVLGTASAAGRARHLARPGGGTEALSRSARETGDPQWRLEGCDHLMALGEAAAIMKAETMEALAETEINATARNTYLWEARRLRSAESGA